MPTEHATIPQPIRADKIAREAEHLANYLTGMVYGLRKKNAPVDVIAGATTKRIRAALHDLESLDGELDPLHVCGDAGDAVEFFGDLLPLIREGIEDGQRSLLFAVDVTACQSLPLQEHERLIEIHGQVGVDEGADEVMVKMHVCGLHRIGKRVIAQVFAEVIG